MVRGVAYEYFEAFLWLQAMQIVRGYDHFFGPAGLGPMPDMIKFTCCSQFLVTRETIRFRPRKFYSRTIAYLADNDLRGNHHVDKKYVLGDMLTVLWGMIFGEPPIILPMDECKLYKKKLDGSDCVVPEGGSTIE